MSFREEGEYLEGLKGRTNEVRVKKETTWIAVELETTTDL